MAGIAKGSSNNKDEKSVEQLKKEYEAVKANIRKILNGRTDKNDLKDEEKKTLRTEYSRAAMYAKQLSTRVTDHKETEEYTAQFKFLSDRAASYGSAMNSTIPKRTLDDVKGLENVKALVRSFIFMAQNPQLSEYYHLEGGLGMMMYGAPGTGKTMFAEAIANAMQLPLFIVTPADIFKSYVGESEQAVKQLFQEIEACPDGAILFVDECESIFSKRTSDTKDYKSAVTTELLQRMNGFGVNGAKRIMIAATNRPDVIDPAYLRYKRFSHIIHVTPPDPIALKAIIQGKLKGIELDDITVEGILDLAEYHTHTEQETELGKIEVKSAYYSGADISGIVEEACRIALERLQETNTTVPIPLTKEMFEKAFKKIPPSIPASLLKEYDEFRKSRDS